MIVAGGDGGGDDGWMMAWMARRLGWRGLAGARWVLVWLCVGVVGLWAVLGPGSGSGSAWGMTDEQVLAAIERMQEHLLDQQREHGGWDSFGTEGHDIGEHGPTALATLALLESGMPYQDARVAAGLRWLERNASEQTYSRSLRGHVWAALPDHFGRLLADDARWLIDAQSEGLFDYGPVRRSRVDHSVTQYGVLGLWEYAKRGGGVPDSFWHAASAHFVAAQRPDGGWNYGSGGTQESYGSMTCAGLTVLYTALQELHRDRNTPPEPIMNAINAGLGWMDRHFAQNGKPEENVGKRGAAWTYYYLYGLERVGLANGVFKLNGRDWYREASEAILRRERGSGAVGGVVDTSFALLFLARGRVPIWANKMRVPGTAWNNRPMDLYFFSQYLSDAREAEQNWLVADLSDEPVSWLNAPILYWSGDAEPGAREMDELAAKLKRYVDLGGLLVVNAEDPGFERAARSLCERLWPGYRLERAGVDGALMSLVERVETGVNDRPWVLSNGARALVVLLPGDWGRAFQAERRPGSSVAHRVMVNLYALASDRGRLPMRLEATRPWDGVVEAPGRWRGGGGGDGGALRVVLGTLGESREPLEPLAWWRMGSMLAERGGRGVRVEVGAVAELGDAAADGVLLLHLMGHEAVTLSEAELTAVEAFVSGGGTVLVESVGGEGGFASGVERQLAAALGRNAAPLPRDSVVLTGEGLRGGRSAQRVLYRDRAVQVLRAGRSPLVSAILLDASAASGAVGEDGETAPAVLISHQDLSLGMMGVNHWPILGYQPESARVLAGNILLAAERRRGGGAVGPGAGFGVEGADLGPRPGATERRSDRASNRGSGRDEGEHVEDRAAGEPALPDRLY